MQDYKLTLDLNVPTSTAYDAIATAAGLKSWWTQFADVEEAVGGRADFRFPMAGFYANFEIAALEPDRRIEWTCVDAKHPESAGFKNRSDWVGTSIRFEFEKLGDSRTRFTFTHVGLTPALECYESSCGGWFHFLDGSFKPYLNSGSGTPYSDDSADNIS